MFVLGTLRRAFAWGALLALTSNAAYAATIEVLVQGGNQTLENVPFCAPLSLADHDQADLKTIRLTTNDGTEILGQITQPGLRFLAQDKKGVRELHFVIPRIEKGAKLQLRGELRNADVSGPTFLWEDTPGKHAELRLGDKPVLRYMYEAVDDSSKERRAETFKVYHHVYDPTGKRLVTKGPGGLFPHHRGVFYGFNRITYDGDKRADTWHGNQGESQTHEAFLAVEQGPVLGRHCVKIAWRGQDGKPFAFEKRELTVYNTSGGRLLEFASRLESAGGRVKLDGDPQHAGVQFRASQEVPDKTAKLTYYLRPDGKDEPGRFRNWPQHKDHVNLPWNAMSFVLGEQRYTCVYLDHPQNPKEARFSERDYGRFGSYFEAEIDGEKTLDVNYRFWLQEGEMTVEEANAASAAFVDPPKWALNVRS